MVVGGAMAGQIKGVLVLGPACLPPFTILGSGKERRDSGSKIDLTLQDGTIPTSHNHATGNDWSITRDYSTAHRKEFY